MENVAYFVAVAVIAYSGCVIWQLLRATEYSNGQKALQVTFVLLIPLFGALAVQAFLLSQRRKPANSDRRFTPQNEND